ncbi:RNase H [Fragilaria crotonensis]|nr:RNase H [Fragilaria crotonensis]
MSAFLSRASSLTMRSRYPWAHHSVVAKHLRYQRSFSSALSSSTNLDETSIKTLSRTDIGKMRVAELRENLASRGLDTSGVRDVLVNRMREAVFGRDGDAKRRNGTVVWCLRFRCGSFLYDASDEDEVWHGQKYFANALSNFEADYCGIMIGLDIALENGVRKLILQGDNEVLLNQICGSFKVTKDNLRLLHSATKDLTSKFDLFDVGVINSAENSRAKSLASRALTSKKSNGLGVYESWVPPEFGDATSESISPISESDAQQERSLQEKLETGSELAIDPSKRYLLQFDGGSRGNPGVAGAGVVIYDDTGHEVWCGWKFLSTRGTNNEAEYTALIVGLKCALSLGITDLRVEGDSELIIKQLDGRYRVKSEGLMTLHRSCLEMIQKFRKIEILHIPRAQNKRADELANMAMDSRESFGFEDVQ